MAQISFLDSIESPLPCSKDWNEMTGDERVRFCEGCAKNVYNLSAMTRREARKFVARNSGKVCVRYVRLADGSVQTAGTRVYKITRRAPAVAAGALGAVLALSASGAAQIPAAPPTAPTERAKSSKNKNFPTSQISFTVRDPNGAGVLNAEVKLINQKTEQEFFLLADADGVVRFSLLPPGDYEVKITAPGFRASTRAVRIKEPVEPNLAVNLDVGTFVGVVVETWSEIPLFTLIAQEENEEVKKFIGSGFDVNTKDKNGRTALHVAVEHENLEIIRFLLERGAKVNVRSKDDRTPLLMIDEIESEDEILVEIVKLLVAKGANVNVQDKSGNTALMSACEEESLEAVRILLEAGANPNLKDEDGETAIERTDSEEIKQLLKRYGAKER